MLNVEYREQGEDMSYLSWIISPKSSQKKNLLASLSNLQKNNNTDTAYPSVQTNPSSCYVSVNMTHPFAMWNLCSESNTLL